MKALIVLLTGMMAMGCVVEAGEPGTEADDEIVSTSSEGLTKGSYYGGGGLLFGNDPNPYADCLNDCSLLKQACENGRGEYDDLLAPCDLEYSICKAGCDRTFPQ